MQQFFEVQENLLNDLEKNNLIENKRYLYWKIDFTEKLIWIVWARWVGKTTMLLQYIYNLKKSFESLYISADNIYFLENDLFEFIRNFYNKYDWKLIVIDEVHKIKNWSQILKNAYDSFPNLQIIFSWSSSLDLKIWNFDLSRRTSLYYLEWFSFREYLNFNYKSNIEKIDFSKIIENYLDFSISFSKNIPILKYFDEYLKFWYYPYLEKKNSKSYEKVVETIDKTIYEDISSFYNLKSNNLLLLKKIINYLAINPPWEININKISKTLEIDNKTTNHYLEILEKVWIVKFLLKDVYGYNILKNTNKIYLNNSVLYYSINSFLNKEINIWTIREIFLINQVSSSNNKIAFSKIWDFKIGEYIFEVWWANKTFSQIKDVENSYLVLDDILISWKNKIPLWLFWFMY